MCKFDVSLHQTYTKLTLWSVSFSVSLHQTYTKPTLQFTDFRYVLMIFILISHFCICFVFPLYPLYLLYELSVSLKKLVFHIVYVFNFDIFFVVSGIICYQHNSSSTSWTNQFQSAAASTKKSGENVCPSRRYFFNPKDGSTYVQKRR